MNDRYRDRDDRDSRRPRDDDRGGRTRDRDDDRGSRDRDRGRDDRDSRSSRDRGRDDDRGGRSRDRDDDRGSRSSGSGRGYQYRERSPDEAKRRSEKGARDYDRIVKDDVKMFKVNDGLNRIRILPPTWDNPEHYGYDLYVNYQVGADRAQFLSLHKMLDQPDPIEEERQQARKDGDEDYAKKLEPKRRCGVWIVDRDHPREGVQFWAMPWTLDRDIVKVSIDRSTGEVLPIDHPEDGYDVEFEKQGKEDRTEYLGVAIARRSTPLGNDEWLDYAVDHPIPDVLQYFDYDHIAKAFGGGGSHRDDRGSRDRDDRDDRDSRSRDRDRDDRGSRDRDDRGSRDRDDRGSRDRDERGSRDRGRETTSTQDPSYTWESVHAMAGQELDDLIEQERLGIKAAKFDSDEALADAICEELGLKQEETRRRRVVADEPDERSDRGLSEMRNRRRGD